MEEAKNVKRNQAMAKGDSAVVVSTKPAAKKAKKIVSTKGLDFPSLVCFKDLWTEDTSLDKDSLQEGKSLFGTKRSWFVRDSYVALLNDILNDTKRRVTVVNGSAGIGKSSFLLYVLAWMRSDGKNVLLHFHRLGEEKKVVYFPAGGGEPAEISGSEPRYGKTLDDWYAKINEAAGCFIVDGIVSFGGVPEYDSVKYIVARSPGCSIGWVEKSPNKRDRWLYVWGEEELLSYANQAAIESSVIEENTRHLGGIVRYAFVENAARDAADYAIKKAGALELFKLVDTGLNSRFNDRKIVDRLLHRIPPVSGMGYSAEFEFASEYVATRVSMALAIETKVETASLLRLFKGVGAAGGMMRGVLFEAYSARVMAAGGDFAVKTLSAGSTEGRLELNETGIVQKDTKNPNTVAYSVAELEGGLLVWPNPGFDMLPAIDMFMFHEQTQTLIAFQMTVSTTHSLQIDGCKAFLRCFDSLVGAKFNIDPKDIVYKLYFVVPSDIYAKFSDHPRPITGKNGTVLDSPEARQISNRISQESTAEGVEKARSSSKSALPG